MIDLRSDTMTRPSAEMRAAMHDAEVGDDVYGEDPTVNRLEAHAAELLGKEAAVFVASGTQSNLCGILAHCQRGDEYLVGQLAHTYKWEGGGAAVLGSVQPQPVEMQADGTMDLEVLASYIKPQPSLNHFAHSKLLALENTHDGKVLPRSYVEQAQLLARSHGLALHLDGARLFNAAVADGVAPRDVATGFDTVSVCLSKGLGAPVGSVLVGSHEVIQNARRWRKMLGGGMRQAGVIAAGGLYALEHNIDRLAHDHRRATELATALAEIPAIHVTGHATNMVFMTIEEKVARGSGANDWAGFKQAMADEGVQLRGGPHFRLVTHLDIDDEASAAVIAAFKQILGA